MFRPALLLLTFVVVGCALDLDIIMLLSNSSAEELGQMKQVVKERIDKDKLLPNDVQLR